MTNEMRDHLAQHAQKKARLQILIYHTHTEVFGLDVKLCPNDFPRAATAGNERYMVTLILGVKQQLK
jgi:hypothetical protein